ASSFGDCAGALGCATVGEGVGLGLAFEPALRRVCALLTAASESAITIMMMLCLNLTLFSNSFCQFVTCQYAAYGEMVSGARPYWCASQLQYATAKMRRIMHKVLPPLRPGLDIFPSPVPERPGVLF